MRCNRRHQSSVLKRRISRLSTPLSCPRFGLSKTGVQREVAGHFSHWRSTSTVWRILVGEEGLRIINLEVLTKRKMKQVQQDQGNGNVWSPNSKNKMLTTPNSTPEQKILHTIQKMSRTHIHRQATAKEKNARFQDAGATRSEIRGFGLPRQRISKSKLQSNYSTHWDPDEMDS